MSKNKYSANEVSGFLCQQTEDLTEREMIDSSSFRYAECMNYFDPLLSTKQPLKILDLGTGKGWMSLLIKKYYPQHDVTATDVAINDVVKKRFESNSVKYVTNCKFEQGKQLPLKDGEYDVCVFFEVMEHIIADPRYIFSEISRFLKKGGLFLFTTPNIAYLFSRVILLLGIQPQFFLTGLRHGRSMPRNHFREWTMREIEILLEDAHFETLNKGYLYGHGGIGVAKNKFYLKPLLLVFKFVLMLNPSFRGVLAITGKKT